MTYLGQQDGLAGKGTCCPAWQLSLVPGTHIVEQES